jgi:hypothetical protein
LQTVDSGGGVGGGEAPIDVRICVVTPSKL